MTISRELIISNLRGLAHECDDREWIALLRLFVLEPSTARTPMWLMPLDAIEMERGTHGVPGIEDLLREEPSGHPDCIDPERLADDFADFECELTLDEEAVLAGIALDLALDDF